MRYAVAVLLALLIVILVPFSVAAVTNSEIIAILQEVIGGVIDAGRDAYCAAGVQAFCP